MKISTEQVYLFLSFLLCLNFTPAQKVFASNTSCLKAAEKWISQLNDKKNTEIFQRHAQSNCQFSGRWVKESVDVSSVPHRERMCQDLVLIWSHKNCSYFRDVINPDAYEPCKAWSREMHQHCIDNDVNWFH
jgi:hypothetical protein